MTAGNVEIQGITLTSILHDSSTGEVVLQEVQTIQEKSSKSSNIFKNSPTLHLVSNWKASQIRVSDPDSITWIEGYPLNDTEIRKTIKVEFATVNPSDLLLATGELLSHEIGKDRLESKTFGLEYSGTDEKGTQIMGISTSGTLSNFIRTDSIYTWSVPKTWTLKDAATVPLAYTVVYNAFYLNGRKIKKGASILIYDGISGFGQAAINLAMSEKCEIIITYNSKDDKKLLRNLYPSIAEDRLYCSSDGFADQVLVKTRGEGVDIVIFNGSDLRTVETCFTCAKSSAKVIVIGDLQGAFSKSVGMEIFLKEVSLYSVIPNKVDDADPYKKEILAKMVKDGLRSGVVKPLYGTLYPRERLSNAFSDGVMKKVSGKVSK